MGKSSFRQWLLTVETTAAEMPELKNAVQTAVQSGQQADQAVKGAMMKKLSDPKMNLDQVADLAKMADKLTNQQAPQNPAAPGQPQTMQPPKSPLVKAAMKKTMRK